MLGKYLSIAGLLLALLAGCQSSREAAESQSETRRLRPWTPYPIVLVTIDTLRADRVGAYGHEEIETPHLDQLAQGGVLFENAVAQAPLTTPSHASMFTGNNPPVHEVRDTGGFVLAEQHTTMAEILRDHGWQTAAFIASSVLSRVFGMDQGFDVYSDETASQTADFPYLRAETVVDRAVEWVESRSQEKPAFLWVHVYDPHAPLDPPAPFNETYSEDLYDGEVAYVDQQLGRLLEAVNSHFPEDTIIAVLSDHGESLSEHGEYSHGVFLYDSTLRIPWVMRGPGIPPGGRVQVQARTIDLLPTLISLVGGELSESVQGVSLLPALEGERVDTTYSYAETLFPKINMGWTELRAVRTNRWKYVRAPRPELYDLTEDPEELENVLHRYPAEARRLEGHLREMLGGAEKEQVEVDAIDPATLEQLRSLGYVSAGTSRTIELTGDGIDPKDRTEVLKLIEDATTTRTRRSSDERITLLRRALSLDPSNSSLFYLLGEAYEKNQRDDEALELYETAIERDVAGPARIYSRMATIYGKQGRIAQAIEAFEAAVSLDPTDMDTQNRLAVTYLLQGDTEKANQVLQDILALDETNAQAYNSLGWLALRRGNDGEALNYFTRALELNPELLEAYINLGMLYKKARNFTRARVSFETFLSKASPQKHKDSIARVKQELAEISERPGG